MSLGSIGADPAGLRAVSTAVSTAAAGLPRTCPVPASVGDPAADAALADFVRRWSAQFERLQDAASVIARQANLTAVAFALAGE
ncbi:hypothetical protein ACQSSU_18190 [Micromonospora echinospora]